MKQIKNVLEQNTFVPGFVYSATAGGYSTVFTIEGAVYTGLGERGVRGIGIKDTVVVSQSGIAVSSVVGQITDLVKIEPEGPPPGVYLALTGGASTLFHDGTRWYRGTGHDVAVKGVDIRDTVTVTASRCFSGKLGDLRLQAL